MGISNLSLSLSHEYHHAYSLQLTNGKDGSKQHLESIEEAYYLAEEMMFVSVFPRRFGVWRQISDVTNIYACTTISDVTNGGEEQLVTSLMVVRAYMLVTSLAPQAPRGCPVFLLPWTQVYSLLLFILPAG
jgi:hypothetical protein